MKNTLTIVLMFFITGCNTPEKLLSMDWKIADIQFKQTNNSLTQQQQNAIADKMKNKYNFYFLKDSVFLVIQNTNDTTIGKWYLSADKKKLTSITSEATSESTILKLNKKEFVVQPERVGGSVEKIICVPKSTK